MAQKQYSRSIARLVLVAGMCFTAIGLCSVSASAIDDTELLQPVAIKEDSLQPIGQSVLLADVKKTGMKALLVLCITAMQMEHMQLELPPSRTKKRICSL